MAALYPENLLKQQVTNSVQDENHPKQMASRDKRVPLSNIINNKVAIPPPALKKHRPSAKSPKRNQEDDPYVMDVLMYFMQRELELSIVPDYMSSQPDLKPSMRCILVDWMMQACIKFKLCEDTQYYAIQYLDRFLTRKAIDRSNLQLIGICSIFLAAKFEEILVPSMADLCYITEDTYTPKELQRMENKMLNVLDYNLGFPTAIQYLRYIVKAYTCSRKQYYQAKFLTELMSVSYSALRWLPSEIAIASIEIHRPTSALVPLMRSSGMSVDGVSVEQCKHFIRQCIKNKDLDQYSTVFMKYEKSYNELKNSL